MGLVALGPVLACERPVPDGRYARDAGLATADHDRVAVAPSRGPSAETPRPRQERGHDAGSGTTNAPEPTAGQPPALDLARYPWHADPSVRALEAVDALAARFAPPPGFSRAALEPKSFGAWLRGLPLAAPGTPVVAYDGRTILAGDDPRLGAVATLDVGTADLQQCADAVMRLHAEWQWSTGSPDVTYRAASGLALPFSRWASGERLVARGSSLTWTPSARPANDHATYRKYLDAVFSWANTVSLARQASTTSLDALRPGDFLVLPGNPGHTVLVLDLTRTTDGRRAVLLGQSYMPAQSYHVLRANAGSPWYVLDPASEGIQIPFWPAPFPWSSLRRLD